MSHNPLSINTLGLIGGAAIGIATIGLLSPAQTDFEPSGKRLAATPVAVRSSETPEGLRQVSTSGSQRVAESAALERVTSALIDPRIAQTVARDRAATSERSARETGNASNRSSATAGIDRRAHGVRDKR